MTQINNIFLIFLGIIKNQLSVGIYVPINWYTNKQMQ